MKTLFALLFALTSAYAQDVDLSCIKTVSNKDFKEPTASDSFSFFPKERDLNEQLTDDQIAKRAHFSCNARVELIAVEKGKLVEESVTMSAGLSYKTRRHGFEPGYYMAAVWDTVNYYFNPTPLVADFDDVLYDGGMSMCDQRKTEYLRFYFVTPDHSFGTLDKLRVGNNGGKIIHDPMIVDIWELIDELEHSSETYRALEDHKTGAKFYLKISQ